jgi:hypothetical protein
MRDGAYRSKTARVSGDGSVERSGGALVMRGRRFAGTADALSARACC